MIELVSVEAESSRLLDQLRGLASDIGEIVACEISDLEDGVQMLEALRQTGYELINQLQHDALTLAAAHELAVGDFAGADVRWLWNPSQAGTADEPDLQGEVGGQVVVSVEVTTSRRPVGTIDQRMKQTLEKLAQFPGARIYYVRTPEMLQRAKSKVLNAGHDIEVRMLHADLVS